MCFCNVLQRSSLVISLLTGYENLLEILEQRTGSAPVDLVNLSTGAPDDAAKVQSSLGQGSRYLDGANLSFPQYIGTDRGSIFLAGSEELWTERQDDLAQLVGEVAYLSDDVSQPNVLDTGYVGLLEIPSLVAFAECAAYWAKSGISTEVTRKMIHFFSREMGSVLEQVLDERGNDFVSESASSGTYLAAIHEFLDTIKKADMSPRQLLAAHDALEEVPEELSIGAAGENSPT